MSRHLLTPNRTILGRRATASNNAHIIYSGKLRPRLNSSNGAKNSRGFCSSRQGGGRSPRLDQEGWLAQKGFHAACRECKYRAIQGTTAMFSHVAYNEDNWRSHTRRFRAFVDALQDQRKEFHSSTPSHGWPAFFYLAGFLKVRDPSLSQLSGEEIDRNSLSVQRRVGVRTDSWKDCLDAVSHGHIEETDIS